LLDKEVNKLGIELMMEMPHIEWCFLEAYKDDVHKVVVFLSMPFFLLQVRIVCPISKMDDNPHLKSCERGKFKVAKFPNKIAKLIH
jgi:hypothetical protein